MAKEIISEGEVRIGVNTHLAEEGLKRLTADFDRSMANMDRRRAQAHIGADITDVDAKIADVKGKLLELTTDENGIPIKIEDKAAKKEIALLRGELKLLGQQKTELRVDSKQLADANKEMDLSAKKQAEMSKQWGRQAAAQAKLTETRKKDHIAALQQVADAVKLEQQYIKLSKVRSRQEREGMFTLGGFPGRTASEERELRKTAAELDLVGAKLRQLGRDTDGLDKKDRFGSKLLEWASRMKAVRISMGPFSAKLGTMIAATSSLAPLILSLVGGLSALVGVLGAGLVGATAAASAGLGGLVLSMGGVIAVSKNLVGHLGEQIKAASDYRDALLKYGKGSEQAEHKLEQLHNITKGISPDARKVVMGFAGINKEWEKLTRPSRKPFFEVAGEGLKTVKALMPEFARETNATFKTLGGGLKPILKELRSSGSKGVIHDLMSNFRLALPDLLHGLSNVGHVIGNISDEASKFLPEITGGFDHWTEHLANETGTEKFKHKLDEMIHQAGDILHLFNVAGKAIVLFFGSGAEAGDEMTNSLSRTIERWNDWMESVEGQSSLHDFFHQSGEDTSNFFGALVPLIATFTKLTYALQPVTSGVLVFANYMGKALTVMTQFAPVRPMLEALGITLGIFFVINKINKWTTALQGGWAALERLLGMQGAAVSETEALTASNLELAASYRAVAAGAESAGAASAVGGAEAGAGAVAGAGAAAGEAGTAAAGAEAVGAGVVGGSVALPATLVIGGAILGHEIDKKLRDLASGHGILSDVVNKLTFGPIDLINKEKETIEGVFKQEKSGTLINEIGVEFKKAMANIRADAILGLGKLNADLASGLAGATHQWGKGTAEWRKKSAHAMEETIAAIKQGMAAGTIPVKQGKDRINKLLGQIHIIKGEDPLKLGEAAAASFKKIGQITPQGIKSWINQLKEMPKGAADQARRSTEAILTAWAKGHPKIEHQVELLTNHLDKTFHTSYTNIMGTFGNLATGVSTNLEGIVRRVHGTLAELTGKTVSFGEAHGNYGGLGPNEGGKGGGKKRKGEQRGGRLQEGGFTVPGRGDGDQFQYEAEEGGYVLNREASRAMGFQRGGVPVLLEPGERYFPPHEAAAIGHNNLEALNQAVPRFQLGGEPQLGGSGELHDLGQGGIHKVYAAAKKLLAKRRSKLAAASSAGAPNVPTGPIATMAKELVMRMFGGGQWGSFNALEISEAGWNPRAENPESGAAGLAQALPPSKYPAGAWPYRGLNSAKLQLQWMVSYIKERYGDPAKAWAFHQANNFYQRGGALKQRLQKGGAPKGSASRAVEWASNNVGAGGKKVAKWDSQAPGEWCGVFLAEDMRSQGIAPPSGYQSASSWANYGTPVSRNNVEPGDILDYGSAHVAMYAGNNEQIQGNNSDGTVGTSGAFITIGGSGVTAISRPPYTASGSGVPGLKHTKPAGPPKGSTSKSGGTNAPPHEPTSKEIAHTTTAGLAPGKINPALSGLLPGAVKKELRAPGLTAEDRSGILGAFQSNAQSEGSRATTKLERADANYTKIHEKALAHPSNAGLQEADKKAGAADTAAHNLAKKARKKEIKAARALLVPLRAEKKRVIKRIKEISKSLGKKGLTVAARQKLIEQRSALFSTLTTLQSSINEELQIVTMEPIPPSAVEVATEEAIQTAEEGAAEGANESAGGEGSAKPGFAEQLATISGAREDLFNTFAPNITNAPPGTASAVAASSGVFGATGGLIRGNPLSSIFGSAAHASSSGGTMGGAVSNTINNFFSAPPPDPHTWTKQQAFELGALA